MAADRLCGHHRALEMVVAVPVTAGVELERSTDVVDAELAARQVGRHRLGELAAREATHPSGLAPSLRTEEQTDGRTRLEGIEIIDTARRPRAGPG